MLENDKLKNFLTAASLKFETHKSNIAKQMSIALTTNLSQQEKRVGEAAPVSICLHDFLPQERTDLISCLATCADALRWREAGFGKLPKKFSKRIYASELIGPEGLFESTEIRIGLLIQHKQLAYPKHWHAAEELYLVLSGNAYWSIDGDPAVLYAPESFVHHKSQQPHSMTTHAEPLLALWGWTGDINGKSYSI
ncbi:dimethylsulfonioproprionate lyase family protein [Paracoccaceae bacterium]|nr:dimethylsulfonioproprionate lyase family protein [Paracoccaceae bacterium]